MYNDSVTNKIVHQWRTDILKECQVIQEPHQHLRRLQTFYMHGISHQLNLEIHHQVGWSMAEGFQNMLSNCFS